MLIFYWYVKLAKMINSFAYLRLESLGCKDFLKLRLLHNEFVCVFNQLVDLSCTVNCLILFCELLNVSFWHIELNPNCIDLVSSPYHFFPSFEQPEI